ncbi:hypothetical protein GT347_20410 [Xylophilus rhododendri]|uniref:Uncharacterized protein n=1 Tax=Xylophilus rhododendri TaxID=2697032 RepID=A0A857JBQ3_9BURK|nr:hypothetical protein [Xylophilus rhododendri]QHJ00136.1 hypothetical protein GT347_20410 [Xylophilus rhododendri]
MSNPFSAGELAGALDDLGSAAGDHPVHRRSVEPLVLDAIALLNKKFGLGNRHAVFVADLFSAAIEDEAAGALNAAFLSQMAQRLRGIDLPAGKPSFYRISGQDPESIQHSTPELPF